VLSNVHHKLARKVANEGDIILPLEVCLIRQGETFQEWTARVKRCSIEAARRSTDGTLRSAAARLGVTRSSLKGHLERAKPLRGDSLKTMSLATEGRTLSN
jgi:DNA-binding NtrC family response regulator